jgi:hypothetical protein
MFQIIEHLHSVTCAYKLPYAMLELELELLPLPLAITAMTQLTSQNKLPSSQDLI